MNKEQLEQLSDDQISNRIESLKLAEEYAQVKGITRQGNLFFVDVGGELDITVTRGDYCNNPSDMMPLVFENKIGLEFIDGFGWTADNGDLVASCYDKPLRAYAIVYLLMQG